MTLRAVGYASYLGIHALIEDLPEDFLARIEPALDAETKERLAEGLRAVRIMRRASRIVLPSFALGVFLIFVGFFGGGVMGTLLLALGGFVWFLTIGSLVFQSLISLIHRKGLRLILAFARAMRGSSLARDLA